MSADEIAPKEPERRSFDQLLDDITTQLHDEDPVAFHGDAYGRSDCARCKPGEVDA